MYIRLSHTIGFFLSSVLLISTAGLCKAASFGCEPIASPDKSMIEVWSQLTQTLVANGRMALVPGGFDQCSLPVTPNPETFGIWGSIYKELVPALILHPWEDDAPLGLVHRSLERNAEWLDAWTNDQNFQQSSLILKEIKCLNWQFVQYLSKVMPMSQKTSRPFVRYATWTTLASLLNELLHINYPMGCDGSQPISSKEDIWKTFQTELQTIVSEIQELALPDQLTRDIYRTLGWAITGIEPENSIDQDWFIQLIRKTKAEEMSMISSLTQAREEFLLE